MISFSFLLKSILFIILFLLTMFFTGKKCCALCGKQDNGWCSIAIGFIVNLAVIELLGWPFMAFHWSNSIFRILVFILLILQLGWACWKPTFQIKRPSWDDIVVALVVLAQIMILLLVYRSDADDSFYVSNVTLFQNSDILNPYDSSFGITSLGTVPMYDFQTWEAWIAVFCWALDIDGATMMHTIMIPILIVLSAVANIYLGRALFDDKKRSANLFYLFQVPFWIMGGYSVFSQGSFLLSRIWQGKAVYLHIVIPVMVALMLKSVEKTWRYLFVGLAACMLAGMALNPTSLYVMGFLAIFMMIVIAIQKREPKFLLHVIPSVVIVIFFTLMIYLRARNFSGQIEAASNASSTFVADTFLSFWGNGIWYFVLFLVAMVLVCIFGSHKAKTYFVYTPIVLMLVVWNPWLGRLIAETVTKVPSYWRVFWLIPASTGIAYIIVLFIDKAKRKYTPAIVGLVAMILPGTYMFTESNGFIWSNNTQKVPDGVLELHDTYLSPTERSVVLCDDSLATTIRQVYENVELIYSRYQYVLDLFEYRGKEQEAQDRITLMDFVNGKLEHFTGIQELLEKYGVDYIIVENNETVESYLLEHGWSVQQATPSYKVFAK